MANPSFASLAMQPDDPILGLNEEYKQDKRPDKVNLGVGVYLNDAGKLPLQGSVRTAEELLVARETTHAYTAMSGNPLFCDAVQELVFGESVARKEKRIGTVQTLGGTGALRLGNVLAHDYLGIQQGHVSNPTWGNHVGLLEHAGITVSRYPYYSAPNHALDREAFFEYLKTVESGSLVLMHACCHNPTGVDLTQDDWRQVLEIVRERELLPFIDMAYQGLGEGLDADAFAPRLFADSGVNCLVASSCSKNFGLYGERTGALHVITQNEEQARVVISILKTVVRQEYSNPPAHGANVVAEILTTPELRQTWEKEVNSMRARILAMRDQLADANPALDFVRHQRGMFSFLGISAEQMIALRQQYGIYGINNSRINIAGLNANNVERVASAIRAVM